MPSVREADLGRDGCCGRDGPAPAPPTGGCRACAASVFERYIPGRSDSAHGASGLGVRRRPGAEYRVHADGRRARRARTVRRRVAHRRNGDANGAQSLEIPGGSRQGDRAIPASGAGIRDRRRRSGSGHAGCHSRGLLGTRAKFLGPDRSTGEGMVRAGRGCLVARGVPVRTGELARGGNAQRTRDLRLSRPGSHESAIPDRAANRAVLGLGLLHRSRDRADVPAEHAGFAEVRRRPIGTRSPTG